MLKVKVIAIGSLKEEYLRAAVAEYVKRLSAYCEITLCELKETKLPDKPSAAEINAALEAEAAKIMAEIPAKAFTVTLCIEGKEYSSEEFAAFIDDVRMQSGTLCLIIGSSFGLAPRVKQASRARVSFSRMTFPHQLMRVMVLEQLYRGMNISTGGKYHK
jgi:23S rRNA (pseudouridine1915-N3)-methyltransferase